MKKLSEVDTSKFFCWNVKCSEYNKKERGNIKAVEYDGKNKDILYLKCKVCGKKFSENKGTIFFNKQTKKDTIVKALKSTSEGTGIRATSRIFDVNKNTVLSWVNEGGTHSEELKKIFSEFDTE
jgi:transposase-like protein